MMTTVCRWSCIATLWALAAPGFAVCAASPPHTSSGVPATRVLFNIAPGGYPPYTVINEDGSVSGIMWDVMTAVANAHGLTIEARQIPSKRVDSFMLAGELDATMRAIEWTENPEQFAFTDGVVKAQDVIFSMREQPLALKSVDDLKGKMLLTHLGFHYPALAPYLKAGTIHSIDVPDVQTMFKRLAGAPRFDGLVSNRRAGEWIIQRNGWQKTFVREPLVLSETDYRLMFSPQWQPMLGCFDTALREMKHEGLLDRILANY
ncbi:substrate-binding periplasmic protein [Marinobacter sp. 1Y8]